MGLMTRSERRVLFDNDIYSGNKGSGPREQDDAVDETEETPGFTPTEGHEVEETPGGTPTQGHEVEETP